jgi:hypothetical protein
MGLLLATGSLARAEEPSRFASNAGLGLHQVGGQSDLWQSDGVSSAEWVPDIDALMAEVRAEVAWRPSPAGQYRARLRYGRSVHQPTSSAFASGSGSVNTESHSTSTGTFQQAEVRVEASFAVLGAIEVGPWVALDYRDMDLKLSDTQETISSGSSSSSNLTSGPTFTYRESWRTDWVGVAASWRPRPDLQIGAEAALSPWSGADYRLDNLMTSALGAGHPSGTGWRAGIDLAWSFAPAHQLGLSSSLEHLSATGATTVTTYSGPRQGTTAQGQSALTLHTWDVGLSWIYAF